MASQVPSQSGFIGTSHPVADSADEYSITETARAPGAKTRNDVERGA